MKKFWIGLWILCAGMCVAACSEEDAPMAVMPDDAGTFVDVRDGNEYHYLRYGNQEWTCENARYIISNIVFGFLIFLAVILYAFCIFSMASVAFSGLDA